MEARHTTALSSRTTRATGSSLLCSSLIAAPLRSVRVVVVAVPAQTLNVAVGLLYGMPTVAHGAEVAAPLMAHGNLPLNYGQGGGETLCFEVDKGQDVDVGFIKVFFSHSRFDLSMIQQNALDVMGKRGLGRRDSNARPMEVLWDEITLPIRQVKPSTSHA
jgi:hypothetical protein